MSHLAMKAEAALLPLVYDCVSLQELIDAAADFAGTPIRFSPENDIDRSIVSPGYPQEDIERTRDILKNDERGFATFIETVGAKKNDNEPIFIESKSGGHAKSFCNVSIGSRYFGNLSIPYVEVPYRKVDDDLVATIAQMLSLACAIQGTYGYDCTAENLLRALLLGRITNRMQIAMQIQDKDFYHGKTWRLVCAAISDNVSEAMLLSGLKRILPDQPAVATEEAVVVLADVSKKDFGSFVREKLTIYARKFDTPVLISGLFDDILACNATYSAMLSFPNMRHSGPAVLVDCDQHKEFSLFWLTGLGPEQLIEHCDPTAIAVSSYDKAQGTDYFLTLRTYIESGKNITETASVLSIHTNTVSYRIKRLHELFGIDLSDADTLFSIMLSFKLLDFIGEDIPTDLHRRPPSAMKGAVAPV